MGAGNLGGEPFRENRRPAAARPTPETPNGKRNLHLAAMCRKVLSIQADNGCAPAVKADRIADRRLRCSLQRREQEHALPVTSTCSTLRPFGRSPLLSQSDAIGKSP